MMIYPPESRLPTQIVLDRIGSGETELFLSMAWSSIISNWFITQKDRQNSCL